MDNPDISDASRCKYVLVPDVNEDSVDIYDDLDVGFNIDAGKTPQESMDLYEEIVTEEELIKESSYAELKSRFEAAQNQIKQLRRRLEEMEIQNTKLNTENCSLKKNISALLRTAKQEVTRKDAEILRLNLGSVKGHKFYTNNLPDRNLTSSRPLTSSPPPPSTSHPPARENYPSKHLPQLSKKENNNCINRPTNSSETRASKESSACHSKSLSILQIESDKHKSKHREEKYQCLRPFQSPSEVWRQRTGPDSNKDSSAPDKTRCHRVDDDSRRNYNSRMCLSKTYLNADGHHKVDGAKSPCQDILDSTVRTGRSRELRQDKAKLLISDSEHGSAYSSKGHHSRDRRKSYRCNRGSNSKDQKRSSDQKRYRDSSKDREGARFSKNYQKAERRHEEEVRKYRRNSLSEASRESRRQTKKKFDKNDIHDPNKDKQKNKHGTSDRSSNNKNTENDSTEGNVPNKKLWFMETLNLTLSPIKNSTVPMDVSQHEPPGDMVHHQSDDENSLPNVEDMCVIDEMESGQSEDVAELTSDIPAHTAKSCESVKDFKKDTDNYNKCEVEKPLEDTLTTVKTVSAHKQSLDMGQNQITEDPTPNSQQSSFIKPQNCENRMELTSESQQVESAPLEATGSLNNTLRSISKWHTSSSEQGYLVINADQPVAIIEPFVLKSREEKPPKTTVWTSFPVNAVEDGPNDLSSRENYVTEDVPGCFKSQCMPPAVLPQSCQQGLSALFRPVCKKALCDKQGDPKETEAVSSTMSMESFPQGLSLHEAIHILTEKTEDVDDGLAPNPSSSTSCTGVSKVSSTTEDLVVPKSHVSKCSELNVTQKNYSPAKSCESNVEPSSSVLVLHDEDSMMHTLNNLKRFPDAISPLKSPIRITKRSHLHNQVNPGDVKSLQTDFPDKAIEVNSKKLDVNNENKYPGSSADSDMHNMVDKATDHLSSLSDTDMEEGEILSESEESVPDYPVLTTKLAMLSPPDRNKPNIKTAVKRKPEDYNLVSKETPGASTQSPKSRFKTVCPAATEVSFSNIDDIMETFKLVRREIRKKYMKLHKTFPKKSFYGMMDNFQKSFLEFVEGAQFGEICSQAEELKSRLKKLITSVFSKVANNGIVKRIFEQQATDLKQKLWDFVDVQVEYLFKDINTTLKCLCKPTSTQAKDMRPNWNENMSTHPSVRKEFQSAQPTPIQVKTSAVVPYRTGLGSRGKDIRMTHVEKPTSSDPSPADIQKTRTTIDILSTKKIPPTPEKNNLVSFIVSQNSSLNDKTDFNILTEQQATSLTFNLVRDSQMGEIFKCLLQGSDLLESSGITGDCAAWPLSTPRKDRERLISITTPAKFDSPSTFLPLNKFDTPSKLIATWSSISPHNMPSPRSKDPVTLNPALFDESCLLEVPSENSVHPQKSHYVLAEDLAVSLTIPSPLKSDSHLSFLQPASIHRMSTPDSVISAHISEDALLDNEDITEQDIHLTLDTDNSSCGSISSVASVPCSTSFMFQPDKPMQALVMEKSNDHFIVKIRQAALADIPLTPDDSLSKTLGAEDMTQDTLKESQSETVFQSCSSCSDSIPSVQHDLAKISGLCHAVTQEKCSVKDLCCQSKVPITHQSVSSISKISISEELQPLNDQPSHNTLNTDSQSSHCVCGQFSKITDKKDVTVKTDEFETDVQYRGENPKTQKSSFKAVISASNNNPHLPAESCRSNQRSKDSLKQSSDLARKDMEASKCERNLVIAESTSSTPETEKSSGDKARKRKKHQEESKAKRCRKEEKRAEATVSTKDNNESNSSSAPLSPNSLSARNVIRKKGEVVMAWTRDEDRAILIDLKRKGPSRETFSALSEKLKKPTGQIAHRFYQLMKLFKKQEKV